MPIDSRTRTDIFEYLLRLGDDRLILGHRLSEWCGHGPILEEDLALTNVALDLIGQANFALQLAGEIEARGRSADDLAYLREAIEFRNLLLVEQPRGDFAFTTARQFLFDNYSFFLFESLQESTHSDIAALAGKCLREVRYHLRHSREWVLRLGDGTEESQERIQTAFEELWCFTGEIFVPDEVDLRLLAQGIAINLGEVQRKWERSVSEVLTDATLTVPDSNQYMQRGSRQGVHSEHLGHLLAEMQILARSYPGASW